MAGLFLEDEMMGRKISLIRTSGDYIAVSINTGKRATRIFLNEDQAQHLSNRLQAFAKGGYGSEVVVVEDDPE